MAKSKIYELMLKIGGKADSSLKTACAEADKNLTELGESARKAGEIAAKATAATAASVAAVAVKSLTAYTEHTKASNSLAAATGAVGEGMDGLRNVMENVYADNLGEDIQDVADAVATVNTNLSNLSTEELEKATEAALALRDAFGYETEETTRTAAAIEKNFGSSVESAFSLIAAGAQNGLDYSGELIDTINEYSSQFSKLGFSADGMFQLLQSGADSTAWNLDKVGDAIKEFSIRSIDGSKTTVEAFNSLGYNAETITKTFAAGGEGANKAFYDVIGTLMDVDDKVKRDATGVALFGTMWEDLGTEAMQAMANASAAAYDTQGALEQINSVQYNDLGTQLEGVKRKAEQALVSIGEQLAPYAQEGLQYVSDVVLPKVSQAIVDIFPKLIEAGKWIAEHKTLIMALAGGIVSLVVGFKTLQAGLTVVKTFKSLSTIFTKVSAGGGILSKVLGLGGVKLALIAGAVALAVAGFILLWNKSEKFRQAVTALWEKLQPLGASIVDLAQTAWNNLAPSLEFVGAVLMNGLGNAVEVLAPVIGNIIGLFNGLIEFISGVFSGNWEKAWQGICDIFSNLFEGLVNIAKIPINAVIGAINAVIESINQCGFTIPEWVPVVGGKNFSINLPEIPMLASGGIVTAATTLVAGEGREPEAILPLSKLAAMLESRGSKPNGNGANAGTGSGETIMFSPVFNFYGQTSRKEAEEAGRVSFAEFKRLYKQMKAEERRKSFSPA